MDLFTITAAVLSGAGVGITVTWFAARGMVSAKEAVMQGQQRILADVTRTLSHLRRNAFITNRKGHRVRYTNTTAEERARAEGEV